MITESIASREAALGGRLAFLNTGTGTAYVQIYDGVRPISAQDPATGTLLAAVPLADPAGAVDTGALTLDPLEPGLIGATGVATWARVVNRNGATAFDMDVGDTLSAAECRLSTTQLYAGGSVVIVSAVLG